MANVVGSLSPKSIVGFKRKSIDPTGPIDVKNRIVLSDVVVGDNKNVKNPIACEACNKKKIKCTVGTVGTVGTIGTTNTVEAAGSVGSIDGKYNKRCNHCETHNRECIMMVHKKSGRPKKITNPSEDDKVKEPKPKKQKVPLATRFQNLVPVTISESSGPVGPIRPVGSTNSAEPKPNGSSEIGASGRSNDLLASFKKSAPTLAEHVIVLSHTVMRQETDNIMLRALLKTSTDQFKELNDQLILAVQKLKTSSARIEQLETELLASKLQDPVINWLVEPVGPVGPDGPNGPFVSNGSSEKNEKAEKAENQIKNTGLEFLSLVQPNASAENTSTRIFDHLKDFINFEP